MTQTNLYIIEFLGNGSDIDKTIVPAKTFGEAEEIFSNNYHYLGWAVIVSITLIERNNEFVKSQE